MVLTWVDGPNGGTPVTAANLNATAATDANVAALISQPQTAAALNATYVGLTTDGQDAIASQRATPLIPWTSAVANRDNARATVLMLGDSVTEGSYITALNNVWGHRLSGLLRQALPLKSGSTRGGQGIFLPNQNANVPFTAPVTFTGAGTVPPASSFWGLGQRGAVLAPTSQSVTVTLPSPATSIDIEWVAGNGTSDTMSVSVDGGAATTYSGLAANTATYRRITFSVRATHTIVISATVGTVVFNGVRVYDGDETSGIHVLVGGYAGALTGQFIGIDAGHQATLNQTYGLINPDLVIIELGVNDYFQSTPVATYQTNLAQLMTNIKSVAPKTSFMVVATPKPYMGAPPNPWSAFLTAMKNAAAARTDAVFVDLGRRIYGANTGDPQGIYYDTLVHPNDKGSALYAQLVGKALTDGILGGPATYTQANMWTAPTLANAWVNYGLAFASSGYRTDANGSVELQGTIRSGTATAGTVLFNLPAGYRPAATKIFATTSADAFGEIRISPAGDVTIQAGTNTWLSLDGIRFLAEL